MSGFLVLSIQEMAECATWYNMTKSVSQSQQNYRKKIKQYHLLAILFQTWVQNFQDQRTVEIQSRTGRLPMTSESGQRVSSYIS